jgi:tetratricopeptide (TPR) repeat protein
LADDLSVRLHGGIPVAGSPTVTQTDTNKGTDFNKGVEFYNNKEYDKAIIEFNKAIIQNSNNADAYNYRGMANFAKNNIRRAIADYEEALRINPNHNQAKVNIENAKRARGY